MQQFGIKGKINLGFAVLFLLLLLSGAISVFEIMHSSVSRGDEALSRRLRHLELHLDDGVAMLAEERYEEAQRHIVQVDSLAAELRGDALEVEQSRYRSVAPGIIAISAGLVLILLFSYFINHFFVNPLVKITQAVNNTVEFGSPFKVSVDSNDEIGELKEAISRLAQQAKKSAKAEADVQPFVNPKKSVAS